MTHHEASQCRVSPGDSGTTVEPVAWILSALDITRALSQIPAAADSAAKKLHRPGHPQRRPRHRPTRTRELASCRRSGTIMMVYPFRHSRRDMAALADNNSAETAALLARTRGGDGAALATLFERHGPRLRRMVDLRLDRRLAGRNDPTEVVREACGGAAEQFDEYLRAPDQPVFLWLRRRVAEQLAVLHRRHLGEADDAAGSASR